MLTTIHNHVYSFTDFYRENTINGTIDIYYELPSCINIRETECNLLAIVTIDTLASIHIVDVSAVVNGELSERVEVSFVPKYKGKYSKRI